MAKQASKSTASKRPKPTTPEAYENQCIALAYAVAEQQLRDGTASAQVISHFLKLGSTKDRLEKEILEEQAKLYRAKTTAIENADIKDTLYKDAIAAMQRYRPPEDLDEYED